AEAYKAGAALVDVIWTDDALTLARYQHAPRVQARRGGSPGSWRSCRAAEREDAVLCVRAEDPDLLSGQDPDLVTVARRAEAETLRRFNELRDKGHVNWCIIAPAIPAWARGVFPGEPQEQAVAKLWDAVFRATRADLPDALDVWREHVDNLARWSAHLNERRYSAIRLRGPGTDLTVGLPERHVWKSGQFPMHDGHRYVANMPTEEVFTMPHKDRVDGFVSSTKPLNYGGVTIDGIRVSFKDGRITEATATQGEDVLRKLIETDEGSHRLGELALVPDSSPISQSGILFKHTLFDENAASHIAIGRSYRATIEGGEGMSLDELAAAGANDSLLHVDWMIGSREVDVDGIRADGSSEPVMRGGEWTF
ncbi:MAG TPA: aminopeptidase, partial [Deinococcales bacterium]|nr:aminopeptidase [Deinococcales bacterium]